MILIRKTSIVVALAALMLLRPSIIMLYPTLDSIVSLIVNLISIVVLFQWVIKGLKTDKWIILTGLFLATLIAITIANHGNPTYIFSLIKIFAAILIWKSISNISPNKYLVIIKYVLFALVLLNLSFLVLFPEGIIQIHRVANEWDEYYVGWWLFGNKNSMMPWIYALNILAQLNLYKREKRNKLFCIDMWMIIATLLTAFLSKSSTTIAVIVIMTLLPLIWEIFKLWTLTKSVPPIAILIGYLVFSIILITSTQFGLFEIAANIFGKDVTFTGRTSAWTQSIMLIAQKPWFGYGLLSSDTLRSLLGAFAFVNTHNTLLETFLDGGVILGMQYLLIIYMLCKKISRLDMIHIREKSILTVSIITLAIAISFEAYTENLMFWNILSLIYYISESVQKNDSRCLERIQDN